MARAIYSIKCAGCPIIFQHYDPRYKFCNIECFKKSKLIQIKTKICIRLECSKEFVLGIDKRKKFCSHKCSAIFSNIRRIRTLKQVILNNKKESLKKSERILSEWKAGKINGNTPYNEIISYIRKYILEKFNYTCSKCGWCEVNQKSGNIPVQIDHIDGNSLNSGEENLRVLCPNCHSLTPTYGALNKGFGRNHRRKHGGPTRLCPENSSLQS